MSEDALLAEVLKICAKHGALAFHSVESKRDIGKGYPDLTIVGRGGVLFAELKTESGHRSPMQTVWHYRLIAAGQRSVLWRPGDLESGRVESILRSL